MATLLSAWQDVLQRIDQTALHAGRNPANIRLIAVGKTFPAADLRALYELGQRDFGENYAQEFTEKQDRKSVV